MNDKAVEELEFEEKVVARLYTDPEPMDPLKDCDCQPTLHLFHGRYTLGNSPFKGPDELQTYMLECEQRAVREMLGEEEYDRRLEQRVWERMLEEETDLIRWPFHELCYQTDEYGEHADVLELYRSESPEDAENRSLMLERVQEIVRHQTEEYAERYREEDPEFGPTLTDEERKKLDAHQTHHFYPVYGYIHSGITISMGSYSCPWDSGQLGYAEVSRDMILEWGFKPEDWSETRAREIAQACVDTYDQYLTGDVYGIVVTCEDPEIPESVRIRWEDSCWGFFGLDYALSEARGMAEHLVRRVKKYKEEVVPYECAI